jgi:uncharacterized LabA/DUF88 family protein
LHLGLDWKIDFVRFRVYLREKLKVETAYYFFGYISDKHLSVYIKLQEAGFVLVFKEHKENFIGKKKGNVDTDIVLEVMKTVVDDEDSSRIILVSGDGDYKKMVDYLIEKKKFAKIIFPNRKRASSLYRKLAPVFFIDPSQESLKQKLIKKRESS